MRRIGLLLALMVTAILGAVGVAAAGVNASEASQLDQENPLPTNANLSARKVHGCSAHAQTFTAGKMGTLERLSVHMSRDEDMGGTFTVDVRV